MKKTALLILTLAMILSTVLSGCANTSAGKEETSGKTDTTSAPTDTVAPIGTTAPTDTTLTPDTTKQNGTTAKTPDTTKVPSTDVKPTEYDFSKPMPASKAVGTDFFNDALFIGNSRTRGFITYVGLSKATTYAYVGLMVNTVFTENIVNDGGSSITVMDAARKYTNWNKVYIMLGTNEIGWQNNDYFVQKYGEIIDELRKIKPNAEIYIQSILPVGIEHGDDDIYYNMPKINTYNPLLQKLAEEKKVYYVNVSEIMLGSNGFLYADASNDGVHINKAYCEKWLEYLKTHTIGGFNNEIGK